MTLCRQSIARRGPVVDWRRGIGQYDPRAGRETIDFDIIVPDGPRDEWPGWFDVTEDRLVRISTWIRDVGTWLAAAEEPQEWAFRLPSADPLRLC